VPLFEWDDSYSVNNAKIDEQHQRFFEIINELDDAMMSGGRRASQRAMTESIQALEEYAVFHFDDEERYMEALGYPDQVVHHQEHARLVDRIGQYRYKTATGKIVLNSELVKTMANWITGHIMNSDKKYAAFAARSDTPSAAG